MFENRTHLGTLNRKCFKQIAHVSRNGKAVFSNIAHVGFCVGDQKKQEETEETIKVSEILEYVSTE